jgi:hypothetical protein
LQKGKDKRGYVEKDEWLSSQSLRDHYGKETFFAKVREYMPEPEVDMEVQEQVLEDGTIGESSSWRGWSVTKLLMSLVRNGEVSEYEKERIRRIKENEDLIKELGLWSVLRLGHLGEMKGGDYGR